MQRDVDTLVRYLVADLGITKGGYLVKNAFPGQGIGIRQGGKLYAPGEQGNDVVIEDEIPRALTAWKPPPLKDPPCLVFLEWDVRSSMTISRGDWKLFESWSAYSGYSDEEDDFLAPHSCILLTTYYLYAMPYLAGHVIEFDCSLNNAHEGCHASRFGTSRVQGKTGFWCSDATAEGYLLNGASGATFATRSQTINAPEAPFTSSWQDMTKPYTFSVLGDYGWNGLTTEWSDWWETGNEGEFEASETHDDEIEGDNAGPFVAFPGSYSYDEVRSSRYYEGDEATTKARCACIVAFGLPATLTLPDFTGVVNMGDSNIYDLSPVETGYEEELLKLSYHWAWTSETEEEGDGIRWMCTITGGDTNEMLSVFVAATGMPLSTSDPYPLEGDIEVHFRFRYVAQDCDDPANNWIDPRHYYTVSGNKATSRIAWKEIVQAKIVGTPISTPVFELGEKDRGLTRGIYPQMQDDDPPITLKRAKKVYGLCATDVKRFLKTNGLPVKGAFSKQELLNAIARQPEKNRQLFEEGLKKCGLLKDKESEP